MESAIKPNTEITTLQKKNIMNAYNLYQIVKREDILSIIHLINSMNNSQLNVFMGVLKKNKLIEDFSKGNLDIKEVYKIKRYDNRIKKSNVFLLTRFINCF